MAGGDWPFAVCTPSQSCTLAVCTCTAPWTIHTYIIIGEQITPRAQPHCRPSQWHKRAMLAPLNLATREALRDKLMNLATRKALRHNMPYASCTLSSCIGQLHIASQLTTSVSPQHPLNQHWVRQYTYYSTTQSSCRARIWAPVQGSHNAIWPCTRQMC